MDEDLIRVNDEVFYLAAGKGLTGRHMDFLYDQSNRNPRRRCRICLHENVESLIHEMVIVHHRSAYVPPHAHIDRVESIQVLDGRADLVLMTDAGDVSDVVSVAGHRAGVTMFHIPAGMVHTLRIRSEWLLFKETIAGPFDPSKTFFPVWSPNEAGGEGYMQTIDQAIDLFQRS